MDSLNHLARLEAESIHIMREVVAEAERPVMLYSVGKDSAVMLHLAKKAFYPAPPDRKSAAEGKRVVLGGRRIIKKKTRHLGLDW